MEARKSVTQFSFYSFSKPNNLMVYMTTEDENETNILPDYSSLQYYQIS